jgi:hypothetical protein
MKESKRWKFWTLIAVPLLVCLLPLLWPDVRKFLHLSKDDAPPTATVSQSNQATETTHGITAGNSVGAGNATGTITGNSNVIGNNNTVNVLPPKKKLQPVKKSEVQSPQAPAPQVSAPNGIAIGGGTVTNPTVNNFGPPLPGVAWEPLRDRALPQSEHPQIWIKLSINRTFLDAQFAVICNVPCKVKNAEVDVGSGGGFSKVRWGNSSNGPNMVGIIVDQPNPLPVMDSVDVLLESQNDQPVSIVSASRLTIRSQ